AIVSIGARSRNSTSSGKSGARGGLPNSLMSAPAMNVRPSQAITRASTYAVSNNSFSVHNMATRTACESALTGGLFRVRTAILSCRVTVTSLPMVNSARRHAQRAVQSNRLAVQHLVFHDLSSECGILVGATEPRWERYALAE